MFAGTIRKELGEKAMALVAANKPARVYYRSHWSTIFFTGDVVEAKSVGQSQNVQAWVVFPAKEWNIAFSYGLSDCCEGDETEQTPEWKPSRLETDLNTAFSLDPERQMAVECIVARAMYPRVVYDTAVVEELSITDKYVRAALTGGLDPQVKRPVEYLDVTGLTNPIQMTIGPNTFFDATADLLRNVGYVEHCIGSANRRGRDLGPLAGFGSGNKDSFIKKFGDQPYQDAAGILWDDQTKKEGRFGLILTTERAGVIPITLSTLIKGADVTYVPKQVTVPIRFETWGLELAYGAAVNEP
jgi:hypothetical protein